MRSLRISYLTPVTICGQEPNPPRRGVVPLPVALHEMDFSGLIDETVNVTSAVRVDIPRASVLRDRFPTEPGMARAGAEGTPLMGL